MMLEKMTSSRSMALKEPSNEIKDMVSPVRMAVQMIRVTRERCLSMVSPPVMIE